MNNQHLSIQKKTSTNVSISLLFLLPDLPWLAYLCCVISLSNTTGKCTTKILITMLFIYVVGFFFSLWCQMSPDWYQDWCRAVKFIWRAFSSLVIGQTDKKKNKSISSFEIDVIYESLWQNQAELGRGPEGETCKEPNGVIFFTIFQFVNVDMFAVHILRN